MGVEIIRLGGERNQIEPAIQKQDLAEARFQLHHVPTPAMSVWLMSIPGGPPIFPWWKYSSAIDDDLNALGQTWAIPNPQSLFDCLFLSQLTKFAGGNVFTIFPGCIKSTGWATLRPIDRETYSRGQGCIYHLHGTYDAQLSINWVPFWEPQSIVRNPNFGSMWRLFAANEGDQNGRCLTFFGLSNPRSLPEVINLLLTKDERRSEKLAGLVDWFGLYSSPSKPTMGTAAVIYTQKEEVLARLEVLRTQVTAQLFQAQTEMLAETYPRTALRILSRQIAL